MKIALLENDEICYGSLKYFLQRIQDELVNKGYQTEYVRVIDNQFLNSKWDAIIGINQSVFSAQYDNGEYIFDTFGCPIFLLIVDSPYHHNNILKNHPRNMYLICLDRDHVEYSKRYYAPFRGVEMGYLLGAITEPYNYLERKIEVLFPGTHTDIHSMREKILAHPVKWVSELFEYLIAQGMENPNISMEDYILPFFASRGQYISQEDFKLAMAVVASYAEFYLRGYYREKVLSVLVEAGVHVTIIGNGWSNFCNCHPEETTLYQSVDFSEMAEYIANSKIVINVMPWFKNGLHDRIPTSMYCGAVCVTDGSKYIKENFTEDTELVLYDLEHLEELPKKIKNLLNNPDRAMKIAFNGEKSVKKKYSWSNMVDECIVSHFPKE